MTTTLSRLRHGAIAPAWVALCLGLGACSQGNNPQGDNFLKKLMPPSPGEVARDAFNVYDPDQRRRSVNLLSNAPWGGEAPYLRTYRLLVDDPDPTVRAACIRALGKHGESRDVPLITPYLNANQPNFVRWESAVALQRLHNPAAVEPLLEALRLDEEHDVRATAAHALGQYAQARVFAALVGALSDDDYFVVNQSLASLRLLTGQSLGEDGAAWLDWADQNDNLFAAQKPYRYPVYVKPPGFLDKIQFWKDEPVAASQQPAGLDSLTTASTEPLHNNDSSSATPSAQPLPGASPTPIAAVRPAATTVPSGAMAVLAEVKDPKWAAGDPGALVGAVLPRGFVQLQEGEAVIAFGNGTRVRLYGPVSFEVNSDNRGYLRQGRLAILHPDTDTQPFMLNTKAMSLVIAEGARIGVFLGADGTAAEIHALDGSAVVSLIDPTSGLVKKTLADRGKSLTVDATGAIRSAKASDESFPQ